MILVLGEIQEVPDLVKADVDRGVVGAVRPGLGDDLAALGELKTSDLFLNEGTPERRAGETVMSTR